MRTIQIRNVEAKIKIDSFTIFNLIIENTTFLRNIVSDLSNDAESFEYLGENKTTFTNDSYFIFNLLILLFKKNYHPESLTNKKKNLSR